MKFFGLFNDKVKNQVVPAEFTNYDGFYATCEPFVYEFNRQRIILLGNVYGLPGFSGAPSDTDELLRALYFLYKTEGAAGLSEIDGDFTLLVYDDKVLTIYRDFKGTGSQIFYNNGFFSNDLKLLIDVSGHIPQPDFHALSFFMTFGFTPPEKTGIKGIKRLKGGELLQTIKGEPEAVRLQDPVKPKLELNGSGSAQDYSRMYFNLHTDAIKRRINRRSKIGLLLSGGYDSGGNLSGIREIYDGDLTSYTISFKDNPHSELEYTRIMADEFGSNLNHYEIEGSEIEFLPEIVGQTGVPFQESGLMINYLVMKAAAADHPDIVLGGDGNDQLFGTANKELALKWFTNVTGLALGQKLISGIAGNNEYGNFMRKVNFYNRKIDKVVYPDRWGFAQAQLRHETFEKETITIDPVFTGSYKKLYENRRLNVDLSHTAFNVILFKAAQMAELFSVPLSFPYMSKPVFDFVNALSVNYKVQGKMMDLLKGRGVSKFIHKKTYKQRMPEKITARKKQGGFVPLSMFFKDNKRNNDFFNLIEKSELLDQLLKDKTGMLQSLKNNITDPAVWFWYQQVYYSRLFNMLVLAIWEKLLIKNETIERI